MHAETSNQQNDIVITGSKQTGAATRRGKPTQNRTNQHEKANCKYNAYDADIIDTPLFREMPNFMVKI